METTNSNKYIIDKILKEYSNVEPSNLSYTWDGFRELVLVDKVKECENIMSLYFKSKDNKNLIKHKPGQYLPFRIKTQNPHYKNEIRTYSLSMAPNESVYRISVKRIEDGLISNYLHDNLNIGDSIEAMSPSGIFTLDEKIDTPVVLISAGIGITPLLSMAYELSNNKIKNNIHFIQAVQNSSIHPFRYDLEKMSEASNFDNIIFYSRPLSLDEEGKDYNFLGYITKDFIQDNISKDSIVYFCGPPMFMKNLYKSLIESGINEKNINYEFFGKHQEIK